MLFADAVKFVRDVIVGFIPGGLFEFPVPADEGCSQSIGMIVKTKRITSLEAGVCPISLGVRRCLNG